MSEITDVLKKEEKLLRNGYCPDCMSDKFFEGPSGGGSVNVKCANDNCGAEFNLCGPFTPQRLKYGKKIQEAVEAKNKIKDRFEIMDL